MPNIQLIIGAILLTIISFLGFQAHGLKKEVARLQESEGIHREQIRTMVDMGIAYEKAIKLCNERTQALVAEGEKRAKDAETARIAAREAGKKNRELADQLLKFKRNPGETSCDAASRLMDDYLDKKR